MDALNWVRKPVSAIPFPASDHRRHDSLTNDSLIVIPSPSGLTSSVTTLFSRDPVANVWWTILEHHTFLFAKRQKLNC
jgi:hypothetical protein